MSDVLALATLIGVSAAVIGVFAAVLQLRELSKQRRRDFENLFVQRYWKIMDDLSLEAIECTTLDGGVVSANDKKVIIAFLMLSEDELDLRAHGWIGPETWRLWRAGMATQLGRWPFHEVWEGVCKTEKDADNGLFSQLREAGNRVNEPGFDPKLDRRWPRPGLGKDLVRRLRRAQ